MSGTEQDPTEAVVCSCLPRTERTHGRDKLHKLPSPRVLSPLPRSPPTSPFSPSSLTECSFILGLEDVLSFRCQEDEPSTEPSAPLHRSG